MGETGKCVKGSPAAQSLSWIKSSFRIRAPLSIQGIDPCGSLLWNCRERTILSVLPGSWKEKCNVFRYSCLAASCSRPAASRLGHPSLVLRPLCYTVFYGEPTLDIRKDKALFPGTAQHNNSGPWHQLCRVQGRKLLPNFPALEVGGLMVSVNAFAACAAEWSPPVPPGPDSPFPCLVLMRFSSW